MASEVSIEKLPKVFISYSWSSRPHEDKVMELAKRLISHGVDVLLDKWDLKEGHDKYKFMEQAVVNPDVCKVLLICDKRYQEKADAREGGVGDETMIISPKLYAQATQDKFIPVVFEADENNKPYLPAYIASRIYVDLSDKATFESEYEKLIRNIHGVPENQKPAIGKKPEWISEAKTDFAPLRDIQRQIKGASTTRKREFLCQQFCDQFAYELVLNFSLLGARVTGSLLEAKISELKPMRDIYTDFLELLLAEDIAIADVITNFFEHLYNTTHNLGDQHQSYTESLFEHYRFFIWESFICTIAFLLHHQCYGEIRRILCHTYFLKQNPSSSELRERTFAEFRSPLRTIEEECNKVRLDGGKLITYTGNLLSERERKPLFTRESLSAADVVLYQMSYLLDVSNFGGIWFPVSYVYKNHAPIWARLKSRKYCEKLLPLFGVGTIDAFKKLIAEHPDPNTSQRHYRYPHSFDSPQPFLYEIKLEEVASLF